MPASLANHLFHVRGVALGATLAGARVTSNQAQAHGTAPRAPKDQDSPSEAAEFIRHHCGIESRCIQEAAHLESIDSTSGEARHYRETERTLQTLSARVKELEAAPKHTN